MKSGGYSIFSVMAAVEKLIAELATILIYYFSSGSRPVPISGGIQIVSTAT